MSFSLRPFGLHPQRLTVIQAQPLCQIARLSTPAAITSQLVLRAEGRDVNSHSRRIGWSGLSIFPPFFLKMKPLRCWIAQLRAEQAAQYAERFSPKFYVRLRGRSPPSLFVRAVNASDWRLNAFAFTFLGPPRLLAAAVSLKSLEAVSAPPPPTRGLCYFP